ncbi:RcnB family protein [Variovorax sp. YR216]|uniref:RcnB family protein n=1 Tax=Variovorax sp. YR216 TaxID=1882828 RepID=UPI00089D2657|nr:RcnB family protein [Variovorax sp. YR216]SEB24109.1 regulator RcnB of Ni and Co efflux [Variovorax sp. YR216]
MIKSKKSMTVVAAALAMCMAGSAFAQDGRFDRGPDRQDRYERVAPQHQRFDGHGRPDFRPQPQVVRRGYVNPYAQWHRGDRLPVAYRGPGYVVNDWHAHRLYAPPRGYQWVGVGGDFVLAAVATGLIAQIIANS